MVEMSLESVEGIEVIHADLRVNVTNLFPRFSSITAIPHLKKFIPILLMLLPLPDSAPLYRMRICTERVSTAMKLIGEHIFGAYYNLILMNYRRLNSIISTRD